jgi:hypothetical protein
MGYGGARALPAAVAADLSVVTAEAAEATLPAGESVSVSEHERAREVWGREVDAPGPTAVAADLSAVKGEADESTLPAGDIVSGSERERAR